MKWLWRTGLLAVLALLLWPEFQRYRAEYLLSDAAGDIERVLLGIDQGRVSVRSAQAAQVSAHQAGALLPGDARAPLTEAIALMLLGQGDAAQRVLSAAIQQGERPELTLNLGRARFQSGNETGAQRAYLRSAWAAPAAITTLPEAMQSELLEQVAKLEAELQAGRMSAPPPLD